MVRRLLVGRWRPLAVAATSVPWQSWAPTVGGPPVTFKALVRPWWFMGGSSLKPKKQPMGVRPRCPALVTLHFT